MPEILMASLLTSLILILLAALLAVYLDLHLYLRPPSDDLQTAARQQFQAARLPGLAFLAVKDQRVVFCQYYGQANLAERRPVTPDTIFQIASVSKLVTATALMRLYDQGKFGLDVAIYPNDGISLIAFANGGESGLRSAYGFSRFVKAILPRLLEFSKGQ